MAQNFPREDVLDEIAQRAEAALGRWGATPDAGRLVRDVWPHEARRIWSCGRLFRDGYKVYESKTVHDKYRVAPHQCKRVPFCLPCTYALNAQRARAALDRFRAMTPKESPMRLWHVVLTAATPGEEPRGRADPWGMEAMKDLGRFMRVGAQTLDAWWDAAVPFVVAYQDFGETPFKKSHPHLDVVVNGYGFREGRVVELLDLAPDKERERLAGLYESCARMAFKGDVPNPMFRIQEIGASWESRRRVVGYALREMVDLTHVVYEGGGAAVSPVGWRSWREDTVDWTFLRAVRPWHDAYLARVENGQHVRRWFGPGAGQRLDRVAGLFGSDGNSHEPDCACNGCDDWERLPPEWQTMTRSEMAVYG